MDNPTLMPEQNKSVSGQVRKARKPTIAHFEYLDALRDSDITNMFGASPYLMEAFKLGQNDATRILRLWMQTFDGVTSAKDRVVVAITTPE